jgi:UDPglucose 6-dehydrogenase
MRVSIFGTGYVGLVTGSCFAAIGHEVICVDVDALKVSSLKEGIIPIHEPGLEELVTGGLENGRLSFSTSAADAVQHADIFFIAVGTPPGQDGAADLKYVMEVAETLGRLITNPSTIVLKSTVPVGTAEMVVAVVEKVLESRKLRIAFDVVSNPEFLKEGRAIPDFMVPDRIVIGSEDGRGAELVAELYGALDLRPEQIIQMDNKSAELTKYAANAMLATRISFMNQISLLARNVGANIDFVKIGMGSDQRIGSSFLNSGVGYGGSCFPKDVRALIRAGEENGPVYLSILNAVEEANVAQKRVLYDAAVEYFGRLSGLTVAVWGLAFKPDTDDVREATSLEMVGLLIHAGAKVVAYDPVASSEFERHFHGGMIEYGASAIDVLRGADALFVLTEWREFMEISLDEILGELKTPAIFDGRNIFNPTSLQREKMHYFSIGRP